MTLYGHIGAGEAGGPYFDDLVVGQAWQNDATAGETIVNVALVPGPVVTDSPELRRLHDEVHVTSVFVTHDQDEAMEVADRVVVMNQGRIEQQGAPDQVYDHPATPFVLKFLGDVNLFHGRDHAQGSVEGAKAAGAAGAEGDAGVSYVRPHEIQVLARAEEGALAATLIDTLTVGPNTRLAFQRTDGQGEIEVELSREEFAALRDSGVLRTGELAHLKPRRIRQFTAEGAPAPEPVSTVAGGAA